MEGAELLPVMAICDTCSLWSCLLSHSFSPKVFKSQIYSISVSIAFNWFPSILFWKSLGNTGAHCFPIYPVCVCVCVLNHFSLVSLCTLMDCGPPGSSVRGILQTRILEWVAMPSSRDLPNPRIEPASLKSPAFTGGFFPASATWEKAVFKKKYVVFPWVLCPFTQFRETFG